MRVAVLTRKLAGSRLLVDWAVATTGGLRGLVCLEHTPVMLTPNLQRLKAGDPSEWDFAFAWFYGPALEAARFRLPPSLASEAEDVAIEALEDLLAYSKEAESLEELKLIAVGIARNKAVDLIRKQTAGKRGKGQTLSLEGLEAGNPPQQFAAEQAPLVEIDAKELARALGELLQGLSHQERGILTDFFLFELSYKEIAEKWQVAMGSVGVIKDRAAEKVRKILARNPTLRKELKELLR